MVKITSWKKTYTTGFLPLANTLVKAISMPKKTPPIAENISPIVGVVNIAEKSQPFPHKTKAPRRHAKAAKTADHDGFSLTRINIVKGTAIQEMLSKNVFLAGVVPSNPMNWNRYRRVPLRARQQGRRQ